MPKLDTSCPKCKKGGKVEMKRGVFKSARQRDNGNTPPRRQVATDYRFACRDTACGNHWQQRVQL